MQLFLNFNYEIWRKETLNCTHGSLRDTIEDLRRSLQPKKSAIEALQQLVAEKEQMLEDMRGLLQAAEEKRQAALAELSAKHQKNIQSLEAQLNDALFDKNSKPCTNQKNVRHKIIVGVGFGVTALCLVIIIVGIFWWKGYFKGIIRKIKDTERRDCLTGTFTLKQIRDATEDFSPDNKIGEGGFGPVYKGQLSDGTLVAVKQLSSRSRQGNGEFLNEIGMISCLQHPNLVKLHGFCIEGDQLILVYEYMENNSLAHALFSSKDQLKLDWATRLRICIGIAKGLAFLHEESRLKIVHRDIKATNVLLDGNLNPKISDFGLARLDEEKTHVTTRIAGTIGYMAPEYALWGYLSYKADVYSYGVVVFEVVSGKNYKNFMPSDNCVCLLDKAFHLQRAENLIEMVDERLRSEVNPTEAITLMKVALLCTSVSPSHRPTMSEVVNMLEGRISIPNAIQQPTDFSEDLRFKAMRDIHQQRENHSLSTS